MISEDEKFWKEVAVAAILQLQGEKFPAQESHSSNVSDIAARTADKMLKHLRDRFPVVAGPEEDSPFEE